MKAKKKLLSFVLAALMLVPCMAALTACEGGPAGHTHTWEEKYSYDSSGHWKKCTQCSETTEKENHNYDVDTCKVCGYVDKTRTPAKKEAMSKYFSGVKATYEKEKFIDSDDTEKEFRELVDRQIDVLAQDILTRLNYVYGNLRADPANEWIWGSSFELRRLDGQDAYKYDDSVSGFKQVAKVHTENMLAKLSDNDLDAIFEENSTYSLAEVDIDTLVDYQKSLLIKDTGNNILASTDCLNLIGANAGQNMKVVDKIGGKRLDTDESKKWIVSDLTTNDAHNALKLAIAQELGGDSENYDYLITKEIDKLGYDSAFNEKLINIINSKIIGVDRINEDNGYYDIIKNKYEGKITPDNLSTIDGSSEHSETDSPRLYKGYKILVPQIVKSALENKFSNTQVSLYPAFDKKAVDYTTNAAGFAEAHKYETVTLLPKADTPYTRLIVKIKGTDFDADDNVLRYNVKVNNTLIVNNVIELSEEEQTLTIFVSRYEARDPFKAYQGNKTTDVNNNIFVNSIVEDIDEYNFIKFTFDNNIGAKFTVTFDGYYDRKA